MTHPSTKNKSKKAGEFSNLARLLYPPIKLKVQSQFNAHQIYNLAIMNIPDAAPWDELHRYHRRTVTNRATKCTDQHEK